VSSLRRQLGLPSRPLVIGHRGHGKGEGENTLASIERAARAGVDAVEIDVRPSRDGRVVVLHDENLERVTDGRDGRVAATSSWAELSAIELAGGGRVPCLEQVLALCRAHDLALNVELKRDVPDRLAAVAALARVLAAASDGPRCWVSSFDPIMLTALGRLLPNVPRALLVTHEGWRRALSWLTAPLGAVAVHPHHSLVSEQALARWHRMGLDVLAWTVNDAHDAERLLGWGVDGLISDAPDRMRALTDR
jgi:glycerophosphoryl diester phosphodiesterase